MKDKIIVPKDVRANIVKIINLRAEHLKLIHNKNYIKADIVNNEISQLLHDLLFDTTLNHIKNNR